MSTEQETAESFFHEMDAEPDNLTLRLIFADWLEDRNDVRADLIRQLVDFHRGKAKHLDVSNPKALWESVRAFTKPVQRIRSLTPVQKRLLPIWKRMWMGVAASAGETNEKAAERAVSKAYRCAGLQPPLRFIWEPSPYAAAQTALQIKEDEMAVLCRSRFSTRKVWQKHSWLPMQVRREISQPIHAECCGPILAPVWRVIQEELKCWEDGPVSHGSLDADAAAEMSFCQHVCGFQPKSDLSGQFLAVLHCGWVWTFEETVVLCEKPMEMQILDGGEKSFVAYPDGFTATHRDLEV